MSKRRVTIRDVAKAANVSSSTVSNVLNNNDYHVSEETKHVVLAAIRELGYKRTTRVAQKTRKIASLAIVISQAKGPHVLADPKTTEVMRGITDYAKELGCKIILHITESWDRGHYEQTFHEQRAEKAVVLGGQKDDPLIDQLMVDGIPFITVDHRGTDHPNVGPDHHRAGELLVKHLVAQGRRRFAMITSDARHHGTDLLVAGVLHSLFSVEIELPLHRVIRSNSTQDGGVAATRTLFDADPTIDALITTDDIVASGALRELKARGVAVPEDCAVFGYGNSPASELTEPPLSTVHPGAYAVGWQAVRWLSSQRQNEINKPVDLRLPVTLVPRGTG